MMNPPARPTLAPARRRTRGAAGAPPAAAAASRHHARGAFELTMTPLPEDPDAPPAARDAAPVALGRLRLDKRYHGDLQARAGGWMLSAVSATPGSAGYVAIERVVGRLQGREGSFVLQHGGSMARGAKQLRIEVVSDSGTGGLAGLAGTLAIRVEGGEHFYDFDYTLPDAPSDIAPASPSGKVAEALTEPGA